MWCINNDPKINYAASATVRTTPAGQLIGQDAAGVVLYALPAETPHTPVGIRITEQGVLEVYSADAVLWKSRDEITATTNTQRPPSLAASASSPLSPPT